MSVPFYVSPEQVIKDKADYARKGIARGRSLLVAIYDKGVLLVAENPSASLTKISEIYDRLAFAGVGKYNEFDRLREAGIRWADQTGFSYSREDVDARALANYYAQHISEMFTEGAKPLEVEVLVAQLGSNARPTKIYRIAYEGTLTDEPRFAVLGGDADSTEGARQGLDALVIGHARHHDLVPTRAHRLAGVEQRGRGLGDAAEHERHRQERLGDETHGLGHEAADLLVGDRVFGRAVVADDLHQPFPLSA